MLRHVHAFALMAGLCLLAILPFTVNADEPTTSDLSGTQITPRTQIVMLAEPSELPNGRRLFWFDWTGGNWNQLTARLQLHDCGLQALWLQGRGWSWHVGLPEPFNLAFEPDFGDGQRIAPGELAAVCAEAGSRMRMVSSWPKLGLGETQVSWLLHPPHNPPRNKQGEALIQYGGGSLYHLVGRLSTQGCNVHTLEIEDKETQRVYEYSFQDTNEQNQAFTNKYKEYIPNNTTIGIFCIDNCYVIYGLDLVEGERDQQRTRNIDKCKSHEDTVESYELDNLVSHSTCGDHWSDGVQQFFALVPVFQDLCKVDAVVKRIEVLGAMLHHLMIDGYVMYQTHTPTLYVVQHEDPMQEVPAIETIATEVHELCHAHQQWYTFKEYVDHNYLSNNIDTGRPISIDSLWIQTPMARVFNGIVGFKKNQHGDWSIADTKNIFNISFSSYLNTNPQELSAEMCTFYLLQQIQPGSEYEQFAHPPYITEELKRWIETYIVLPEPGMATDQG